jgi:hypothetical protein
MKTSIFSLLVALALPLTAGQWQPAHISPEAKWLVHADFDAMRNSESGKAVFSLLEADQGKQLRALSPFFALQPLNQLHGITCYGDGKFHHATALIAGQFDRPLIENLVKIAPGYAGFSHAGFDVHSWLEKGTKQYAAFASDGVLVFSRQEQGLKQALDVFQTPTAHPVPEFLALEAGQPLVVARARMADMDLPADLSHFVQLAKSVQLAVLESTGRITLRANAETGAGEDAERLRRMLDGMLALAESHHASLEGLDLRSELDAITKSRTFSAAFSLPVGELFDLIDSQINRLNR